MPVRLATKADLPIMARVLAASFGPDPLFQVIFPGQREHPDAFVQAMEESLWLCWYDYSRRLMVSYYDVSTEVQPSGEQRPLLSTEGSRLSIDQVVTGVAEWKREGDGWEAVYGIWGRWDPRKHFIISTPLEHCFVFKGLPADFLHSCQVS